MEWNDWLRILRWRALEEGDEPGAILPEEQRREATARTRAGLSSEEVEAQGALSSRERLFLNKRAEWLERERMGCSGSLVRVMERLNVAQGRWSWALAGWLIAGVAGYVMAGLGQEAEFNLLALPLAGVLLWNAAVMGLALVGECWPAPSLIRQNGWLGRLASVVSPVTREDTIEGEVQTGLSVDQRFALLAGAPALERLQGRLRAWLHVAAAVLALGSAIGLYARGWSHEYRAVWESTLLNEHSAVRFFDMLFAPASHGLGLPLPLEAVTGMHRTGGSAAQPAPALPWIHLYAGTLLLLVIVPRLSLAGLTLWRTRRVLEKRMRSLGWQGYLLRLLRAVEGGQQTVAIIIHAITASAAHREVWTRGVRGRFGELTQTEMTLVPLGDEDDFIAAWKPTTSKVVTVFNLATTPEPEVQRRFLEGLRQVLLERYPDAELVVLLDATSIGNRWSPDKIAGRERLWTDVLRGTVDDVIIATRRAA